MKYLYALNRPGINLYISKKKDLNKTKRLGKKEKLRSTKFDKCNFIVKQIDF